MNELYLCGTALGTPEVKTTENGLKVAELILKVNKSFKNKDGNVDHDIVRVNLFKKLADESENIVDGTQILLKGHIYMSNFNKDGKVTYWSNIAADRLEYPSLM